MSRGSLSEQLREALAAIARLEGEVSVLRTEIARRDEEIARKDVVLVAQVERIADLEAKLGDQRRGGKRQAAPFSKGCPEDQPETAGT